MDCSVANCDYRTPENVPTYDQILKALEVHAMSVHSSGGRGREEGDERNHNMKVTKCAEWTASQTYEAFERDLKEWRDCTKLQPDQQNMLFREMLKKTENEKVKEFYENHLMNSINTNQDIDSLMNKFKDKFGRTEKSEWKTMIETLKEFSWKSGENTERALDRLKELRTRMTKLNVKNNLDKLLVMIFLKSGEKESNLDKAEMLKIEEEIEKANFQWDEVEKTFKKYKIEQEQDKVNETNYMGGKQRESRRDYSKSRDRRYYKSPGGRFHRSFSRFQSPSQSTRGNRNSSFHRSSTPKDYRSPNKFDKNREANTTVSEKLEKIETKLEQVSKQVEKLCSNNTLNTTAFISNLGEKIEEHCVRELFWTKNEKKSILLDSGAPKSVVGQEWFQEYIQENNLKESDIKKQNVTETFKFGAGGLFESKIQVEIPFKIKDNEGDISEVKMKTCIVDHDIPFLCGRDNIENLGVTIDFSQKTIVFKKMEGREYKVRNSQAGHYVIDFERVDGKHNVTHITEEAKDEEIRKMIVTDFERTDGKLNVTHINEKVEGKEEKKELKDDLYEKVRKIHRHTNHKQEESMKHIYKDAGYESPEINKTIKEVIKRCETCQKTKKSQSAPKLSFMKASSFNDILTLDLKEKKIRGQKRYILWIICAFSRFAKGMALKSKEMSEVTKALYHGWFCNYGCPSRGLWADNGTEFRNKTMESFCRDWNITIKFGAPYSPFSNGLNERNHYSCDTVVSKMMEDDKKTTLQEACNTAAWTHNTNKSRKGFLPLQIATGKAVTFPGIERKIRDENIEEDKAITESMKKIFDIGEFFRRKEFRDKIELAEKTKMSKYKDEIYEIGDEVLFQEKENKEWFGPGKVVSYRSNEVEIETNNGIKRIHPCRVARFYKDIEEENTKEIQKKNKGGDVEVPELTKGEKRPRILTRKMKKQVQIEEDKNESYFMNEGQRRRFLVKKKDQEKSESSHAAVINQTKEECFSEEDVIYVVELPVKEHGRPEVIEAKDKEIENLKKYEVFEKVKDEGQQSIGTRWVITQKENHDGQKTQFKARLVARGFQEVEKVQSDSPTALRDSFRMFLSLAATTRIEKLRSIDIRAAFLQSDKLKREVFVKLPKDIAEEGILWKLQKPLYGLTDAGRRFWLRVKAILEENGYKRVTGDEAYYYKQEDGKLIGQLLLHVDDFMMAGDEKFVNETTKMFEKTLTVSKIEDDKFRFCGVNVSLKDGKILVEMEDYADSLFCWETRIMTKLYQYYGNQN